jgi:hypothetical protein
LLATIKIRRIAIMTTHEKFIRRKQSLLELAEYLQNVSQACKINGVSRQHFYDIKKAYEEQGIEGLREKTRRKPCLKNRVVPEIEAAVLQMAYEYPAYGQTFVRMHHLLRRGACPKPPAAIPRGSCIFKRSRDIGGYP